jgi:AraC-like DNA-binding protein
MAGFGGWQVRRATSGAEPARGDPCASRRRGTSAAGRALRVVPARTPALRLLTAYLRGLVGQPAPDAPPLADAVARHVTELIELSLAGDLALPTAARGVRAARLSAIRADVDRHLTDPALDAAAVARRTGIGTRYLHRLFEDEPTTFSRFVLDRRLDLVHHRLRDPRLAAGTLAALAADAGSATCPTSTARSAAASA